MTSAPPWRGPPLWLLGDLHPGNLLVHKARQSAVIDWGDLTSGDPATDLASARMLLPAENHAEFRSAGGAIDEATWQRSAAWAIAFSLAILTGTGPSEHLRPVAHRTLAAVVDSICCLLSAIEVPRCDPSIISSASLTFPADRSGRHRSRKSTYREPAQMSVSEADHHHLLERAIEALGREAAMTLAAQLPPVGDQIATRGDLAELDGRMVAGFDGTSRDMAELEVRMDLRFDAMISRLDAAEHELTADFHRGLAAQTRTYVVALVSTFVAFAGVIVAALQLAGR